MPVVLLPGHCLNVVGESAASQVLIVEMEKDPQILDGKRIREKGSDYLLKIKQIWCADQNNWTYRSNDWYTDDAQWFHGVY